MKMERIVKKYYDGLEEGVIYGRRCTECGAVEFPPHYACNTCGYHETEWMTLSGRGQMESCILPGPMTARENFAAVGPYCFGAVRLEEGPAINATIFGVEPERAAEIRARLPLPVRAKIVQMDGYKALFFELAEAGEERA